MHEENKNLYQKYYLPALVAVFLAAFFVYLPALKGGFLSWDDPLYITDNLFIRSFDLSLIKGAFTEIVGGNWHPLTMLSHGLDYSLFGLEPFGHHLVSILLHALNSVLVFILCVGLTKSAPGGDGTSGFKAIAAGVITAFIFAVHPLHVESVAWLSERKDLLSAFFFLLCLITYIKYVSREGRRGGVYVLALVFFFFSLMSKPMAVTLPAVLIILDIFPFKRFSTKTLIEKIPFFLLSIIFSAVALFAQRAGGALNTVESVRVASRIGVAARGYIFYLYKVVWPIDLAPLYPYPKEVNLLSPLFGGAIILIIVISVVSLLIYKKRKEVIAAWALYLIMLLPVIGFIQVGRQAAADRYAYLPTITVFFLIGLGVTYVIDNLLRKARVELTLLVLVAVLGVLCAPTLAQTRIWHDNISLWTYEISLFPASTPVPYINRGNEYMDRGEYASALLDFNKAIAVHGSYALAFVSRGLLLSKTGETLGAQADFERAIKLNKKSVAAYNGRGLLLKGLGRFVEAKADFTKGIELDPKHPGLYNNRGLVYLAINDNEKASLDFSRALALDPEKIEVLINRGILFNRTGRFNEAIADFTRVIEISPDNADAYNNRGGVKLNAGDQRGAIPDLERAVELNPAIPDPYLNLGHIYRALGNEAEATRYYKHYEEIMAKERR